MYPIKHSYASFTAGLLFEKKIGDYTIEELRRHFDIYNVRWIVCWYEESKQLFDRFPDYVVKAGDIDRFTLYEVKRPPSFFLKGRGQVQADYNRLELATRIFTPAYVSFETVLAKEGLIFQYYNKITAAAVVIAAQDFTSLPHVVGKSLAGLSVG